MSRSAVIAEIRRLAELLRRTEDSGGQDGPLEDLDASTAQLVEMQRQLEVTRDRYVSFFDFAPIGYAVLDRHGVVTDVNLVAAMLLGRERARIVGYPFHSFLNVPRPFVDFVREARGRTSSLELSVTIKQLTGDNLRPARLTIKRLTDQAFGDTVGGASGFVMAIVDLTEQTRMEAERRRADEERQRLEEEERIGRVASDAKDRFMAVLSHELRTPLTPILFALRSLRENPRLPNGMLPTIDMIERNVELEARLIDDLLDVTRIMQGKMRLAQETVDAHAVAEEVVALCAHETRSAGLAVSLELGAAAHHVRADGTRLRQVLWNLLKNAIRNTPAEGTIAIGSENPADDRITLWVSDTGAGIAPDVLPRLFQPFVQGAEARERSGGLGLGLAISKGIVEAHGGRIAATSRGAGRGARFAVDLPTAAPVGAPAEPRRPRRRAKRARKVLLVEDNRDNAAAIAELLRASGYEVDVADSVAAALDKAGDQFDVLVSDIGLPDGTGRDLVERLGAAAPPAIALTGYGTDGDVRRNAEAGFARHLTKPVEPEVLVAAIEELAAAAGENARRHRAPRGA